MTDRVPDAAGTLPRSSRLDPTALLRRAVPALLVVGVWLLFHPYKGVVHDSRLYVAQALRRLHPEVFDRDLFFAFGSQDAFTVYSPLFAFLINHLGLVAATMLVTAVGQALWLSGATALALRLVPGRIALAGLVLVAGMWPAYSGWQTFSYGEGFATPRLLVEGLSLWALYALSHRRLLLAVALVLPALLLHPLVAAAVLCAGFIFLVFQDARWSLLGLVGAALIGLLAATGIAPFDRLTETTDPEWLAVLEQRNVYLFPALWTVADWSRLALAAAMALSAASLLAGWRRHMILAIVVAGLGGVLVTHIGADILHNLFVMQVQPYRTLWLLYPIGYLGAGIVLTRLWQEEDGPGLTILMMLLWFFCLMMLPLPGAMLGIALLGLAVARLHGLISPLPTQVRTATYIVSGMLIGLFAAYRVALFMQGLALTPEGESLWFAYGGPSLLDVAILVPLWAIFWHYRPSLARRVLPGAALLLVLVGAGLWDRRDAWTRAIMADDLHTPFEAYLGPDAQVFWEDDVRGAWLALKRPSYVSAAQGAGIVFARRTALTFRDRVQVMEPLGYELMATWGNMPQPLPMLDRATLAAVCRDAAGLDALVLSRAVEGSAAAAWDLPAPIYDKREIPEKGAVSEIRRLYLYRCADLR